MMRTTTEILIIISLAATTLLLASCEKFLNPEQELAITEDQLYSDWYEYRSIEMGMYGLQQQLVEQLLLLGELRGDLLTITENADADMIEIHNFSVSEDNKYASPTNFFKLISACNSFIRILEREHPEVLDHSEHITNYDRLYGEALTMRAWAYFNAVRIYGKVPYIPESLTTMEEIDAFLASDEPYIDSIHIEFGREGFPSASDTTINKPIELEKQIYDLDMILDYFTNELENDIKAIGVNHYITNYDETWDATIWTEFGLHALLGHMYLTQGDYTKANEHFEVIMDNNTENLRYHLDDSFQDLNWSNIFTNIDIREHIYTIWFNKSSFQQNRFQEFFETRPPHKYMIKPSYSAIKNWESVWRYQVLDENLEKPEQSKMTFPGVPTDWFRGMGFSYLYVNNNVAITEDDFIDMYTLRASGDLRNSSAIMANMDTVVYKYSIDKNEFDQDANYIIYRAAGIHLYMAELYTYWVADHLDNGVPGPVTIRALSILNDGSYYDTGSEREELGVRGRVGLGGQEDGVKISNNHYIHDPYTNRIIEYVDLTGSLLAKQEIIEEAIIDERARELAFEGERFYDLMRVAKRRGDPSFLAKRVAAKFPAGKRSEIEALLMDESNWYINYFE